MSAPKCTSWLGHKFEARYSTSPVRVDQTMLSALFWAAYQDRSRITAPKRNYECDVCTRCGHVVQPPSKEGASA